MNVSGLRFFSFLTMHQIKVATKWFKKKIYATWIHSRSKNPHQIDHFLVNGEIPRISNAGTAKQLIDSDHSTVIITFRLMKCLKLNIDNRKKLLNLNYSLLSQADVKERFNAEMTIFANGLNCTLETILLRKTRTQLSRSSKKEDIFFPLIDIRNV